MAGARVTVLIPTYNRSSLLREAVESVLAQTYADFRIEISDNASTDDTAAVATSFDDSRIDYIRQPENVGILANHNLFLARVSTEFALILPDDDLVYPDLLRRAVETLDATPRAGVMHSAFDVIGPGGDVIQRRGNWTYGLETATVEDTPRFVEESMRWSCRICGSTAVFRTAAIPEGGMRAEDMPAIDFGMWLRMSGAGWAFAFLPEALAAYRVHPGAHSAGFGAPQGPGYVQDVEIVSRLRAIKDRFLDEYGAGVGDEPGLRRLARRARRRELVVMARNQTLPERRPGPTFRALWKAARVDPAVGLDGDAWRLAGASLLGPRLVERLRGGPAETA